jgi:DNA-binding XRE family transcriptional regulator
MTKFFDKNRKKLLTRREIKDIILNVKSIRRNQQEVISMGYKLKQRREQMHLTQAQLAEMSGISRQTISSIENNEGKAVTSSTLAKLAKALGTTIGNLFFADNV